MNTPDRDGSAESDGLDAGGGGASAHDDLEAGGPAPVGAPARTDWDRYGLGPTARSSYQGPQSDHSLRRRTGESRDDLYLDYRRENATRSRRTSGHSSRFVANALGAAAVGILAIAVLVAAVVTSGPGPTPTPRATIATATSSPTLPATPALVDRLGEVDMLVDLPVNVFVPDRAQFPDDGTIMFLAGGDGGIAVDPATGAVGTVFGGQAFSSGVRRTIVATGNLWISSWPTSFKTCGQTCWARATTYRLNVGTGKIQKAYPGTYLVGLAADGLWLASGSQLERLDPSTGAVASVTPWKSEAEPRIGCGGLWSMETQTKASIVTGIDPATGEALVNPVVLPLTATYGPIEVESSCWMMSGFDGVSSRPTSLYLLNTESTQLGQDTYPDVLLVLDGEFWKYSAGGVIQRFEARTATSYGPSYKLSVAPANDDAGRLFASVGKLWMIEGQQLAGFNILLGPEHSVG